MFLNHCVSLLLSGESTVDQNMYTDLNKILFKLETGVSAKRLDSIKTALMMIEAINATKNADQTETLRLFSNFVTYTYDTFSEPVTMAIMKYALSDRKLVVKRVNESVCWEKIAKSFKSSLIDNSTDPKDVRLYNQFIRCYAKLKLCKSISENLNDYIKSELKLPTHTGSKKLIEMFA